MREFGVGRPAVRDALVYLRNMGLIEIRSGGTRHATDAASGHRRLVRKRMPLLSSKSVDECDLVFEASG